MTVWDKDALEAPHTARNITPELLRELIDCDPQTGVLIWRERPAHFFLTKSYAAGWNKRFAGTPALDACKGGGRLAYRHGTVFGVKVKAHRAIWAIVYGRWPEGMIDHINGDSKDNRIENLREVNASENARNVRTPTDNTSGRIGVYFRKGINRWVAKINENGRCRTLGQFKDFSAACAAREAAERAFGYHQNHGRRA